MMQSLYILTLVVTVVTAQLQVTKIPPVLIEDTERTNGNDCPSDTLIEEAHNYLQNNTNTLMTYTVLPNYYAGVSPMHPVTSCKDIRQDLPSQYYWILSPSTRNVSMQYCDQTQRCNCNSTGGWMRVANIDMSVTTQQCPQGFIFRDSPRRSCGKPRTDCTSTMFPTFGVEYTNVCGRVKAYQVGTTDAFLDEDDTIDEGYVDGVSLTYNNNGSQEHIWTFASAHDDTDDPVSARNACHCTRPDLPFSGSMPPTFVGEDYFCETGAHNQTAQSNVVYSDDPLWDGQGCEGTSTCCSFNNPPWFCKQLSQPTTSDIEMRLCHSATTEDSPFEIVEIYVQ